LLAGLLAALAAGCTVGPDYVPPRPAVPAQFTEQPATPAQVADATARLKRWWAEFHDPLLDRLVDRAIAENYDLRIARQQLLAARESRLITAAGDDPVVNFGGSFSQDNSSTTLQYPPGIGAYRTYELGFDASYELDVFGGRRRAEEAADAQVAASIDDRRSILVSLLAELAADYTRLRGAQLRLSIAQRNVEAERQGLQLTQAAFDRGLGTDLEVAQARAQLETVQSDLPALQATIAVNAHAIGVLVGDAPGALEAELDRPAPLMPAPPVLPASVPSEVVAMRPDIGRAERRYAAANAQVGVAVAAEFPHFSIPLTLQPTSSYVSQLFRQASLVWMAGVVGTQRVYDGGRTTAEIRRARATAEQARLSYGGTVLVALREVEDALSGYRTETQRYATLRAAAADAALAQDRATKLYAAGLTDFLHVLEADRTAYLAQDRLARSQQAEVEQTIALFKALGGGWQGIDFGDPAERG
jgi:NodT family efflux transporter outer membrane factor (OMF) lipoprotein